MKKLIAGDPPAIARLADRLKQASSPLEFQRIQCVLIRLTLGSSAPEIARLLGWSTATVHVVHSRWARDGDAVFDLRERGGRHHQHLSEIEERELLAPFLALAAAGGTLKVTEIREAFQARVGKVVAPSTIYRLLERHGWDKGAQRTRGGEARDRLADRRAPD